jgi:hypothetical protein
MLEIGNTDNLGFLLWVSKWFKPDKNGRYFTGETREQIIERLKLKGEDEKTQEANIQYYLALRNYHTLKTEKAKEILDKAQKQFSKVAKSEYQAQARKELIQNVVQDIKRVGTKVAEAGESIIKITPYLPYIAIGLVALYIFSKRR